MRIQIQRSTHGCWIVLFALKWLSYQHQTNLLHARAARSPGKPGSTSNKARLTTKQNLDRSSTHSSAKVAQARQDSSKKKNSQTSGQRSKSKSRESVSLLTKSHRGRAVFEEDELTLYPDTTGLNINELDEDYEQENDIDFDETFAEEEEFDDQVEMDEDTDDVDDDRHSREKSVRKHTDRRDLGRVSSSNQRRASRATYSPPKASSRSTSRRVVPYSRTQPNPAAMAFTRGIAALRESIPDASALRETALSTLNAAKETTGVLTANLYREVKGLTSSELEQVMLKATRPDDSPAKGKHVERLVGVTYQISARYDIYDAVLRKLWSKMCEKDWRTTIKALYVLHRFSADGAPDHQPALKARLRELRRTKDPKRKEKYFNSKQLLSGDSSPSTVGFRAFLARYSHYVLLRAQCFGGTFSEMSISLEDSSNLVTKQDSKSKGKSKKNSSILSTKVSEKPITSTALRSEHLDAAQLLLKAATVCALKDDEECENTAICVERVVADLIALTAAVAKALNLALERMDSKESDRMLLKKWCEFYSKQLLPETKTMMKNSSPILDTYGLFLPSRIGPSVNSELLEKGLSISVTDEDSAQGNAADTKQVDVTSMPDSIKSADVSSDNQREEKSKLKKTEDSLINNVDGDEEEEDDETQGTELDEESVIDEEDEDETNVSTTRREPAQLPSKDGALEDDDEYEYYDEDDEDDE